MTTIAAVEANGKIAIARDSVTTYGGFTTPNQVVTDKVMPVGNAMIGFAGLSVFENLLHHYVADLDKIELTDRPSIFSFFLNFWHFMKEECHFVKDDWDDEEPTPFADIDAEFLLVAGGSIFHVKQILSVREYKRFCVIGSGASHAEGALDVLYDPAGDPVEIARRALEVAARYDRGTGGEIVAKLV